MTPIHRLIKPLSWQAERGWDDAVLVLKAYPADHPAEREWIVEALRLPF